MDQHKIIRIASVVVGIAIFILIVIVGFRIFSSRAASSDPRDVVVSDISQNTAKITWTSDSETQSVIEYGTSPTALNFFAPETQSTKDHSVDLTLLSPTTTYYFQIAVGEKKYDNGGVPWSFTTRGAPESQPADLTPVASPSPTIVQPTPVQTIVIPPQGGGCNETDCAAIKAKLGQGCSTQDYFRCIRALTPTESSTLSPTP